MVIINNKKYLTKYYLKNREKLRQYSKTYYLNNKEKINQRSREWHKNNRDKENEYQREKYYEKQMKKKNLPYKPYMGIKTIYNDIYDILKTMVENKRGLIFNVKKIANKTCYSGQTIHAYAIKPMLNEGLIQYAYKTNRITYYQINKQRW